MLVKLPESTEGSVEVQLVNFWGMGMVKATDVHRAGLPNTPFVHVVPFSAGYSVTGDWQKLRPGHRNDWLLDLLATGLVTWELVCSVPTWSWSRNWGISMVSLPVDAETQSRHLNADGCKASSLLLSTPTAEAARAAQTLVRLTAWLLKSHIRPESNFAVSMALAGAGSGMDKATHAVLSHNTRHRIDVGCFFDPPTFVGDNVQVTADRVYFDRLYMERAKGGFGALSHAQVLEMTSELHKAEEEGDKSERLASWIDMCHGEKQTTAYIKSERLLHNHPLVHMRRHQEMVGSPTTPHMSVRTFTTPESAGRPQQSSSTLQRRDAGLSDPESAQCTQRKPASQSVLDKVSAMRARWAALLKKHPK